MLMRSRQQETEAQHLHAFPQLFAALFPRKREVIAALFPVNHLHSGVYSWNSHENADFGPNDLGLSIKVMCHDESLRHCYIRGACLNDSHRFDFEPIGKIGEPHQKPNDDATISSTTFLQIIRYKICVFMRGSPLVDHLLISSTFERA